MIHSLSLEIKSIHDILEISQKKIKTDSQCSHSTSCKILFTHYQLHNYCLSMFFAFFQMLGLTFEGGEPRAFLHVGSRVHGILGIEVGCGHHLFLRIKCLVYQV